MIVDLKKIDWAAINDALKIQFDNYFHKARQQQENRDISPKQ